MVLHYVDLWVYVIDYVTKDFSSLSTIKNNENIHDTQHMIANELHSKSANERLSK